MKVDFEIIGGEKEIKYQIMLAISNSLNNRVPKSLDNIKTRALDTLYGPFRKSDTYNAIVNGPLDAHFGIIKGEAKSRIDSIIDIMVSQIQIRYIPLKISGDMFNNGGIQLYAIEDDFRKIKDSEFGVTINVNPANPPFVGLRLPWLEWLLFKGGEVIIHEHKIIEGSFPRKKSRSTKAIMEKDGGVGWAVPTKYQGTEKANFITEAIANSKEWLETEFTKIFKEEIQSVL